MNLSAEFYFTYYNNYRNYVSLTELNLNKVYFIFCHFIIKESRFSPATCYILKSIVMFLLSGFLFIKDKQSDNKLHWKCKDARKCKCV